MKEKVKICILACIRREANGVYSAPLSLGFPQYRGCFFNLTVDSISGVYCTIIKL